MKNLQLGLIVLITTFGSACTTISPSVETAKNQHQQSAQQQIQQAFNQLQTTGVIVIKDKHGLHSYGNDLSRAQTPYVPASTFKILNALIGLEHGKATSTEVFKWDGQKRSFPTWEKDMTLGPSHASICRSRLSGASTAHWPRPNAKRSTAHWIWQSTDWHRCR